MGQSGTVDSHGQSHLSYMVQWDRTDSRIWWARVGQWIPMDSPTYPTWYSGIGRTVGLGLHLGKGGIPLDSPVYPIWTLGMVNIHRKSKIPVNTCNRHRTGGKGNGCP